MTLSKWILSLICLASIALTSCYSPYNTIQTAPNVTFHEQKKELDVNFYPGLNHSELQASYAINSWLLVKGNLFMGYGSPFLGEVGLGAYKRIDNLGLEATFLAGRGYVPRTEWENFGGAGFFANKKEWLHNADFQNQQLSLSIGYINNKKAFFGANMQFNRTFFRNYYFEYTETDNYQSVIIDYKEINMPNYENYSLSLHGMASTNKRKINYFLQWGARFNLPDRVLLLREDGNVALSINGGIRLSFNRPKLTK